MKKVEHIGIAVKSLSDSIPLFEKLLNSSCYKIEKVESEKVNTAFFQIGETKIELLESQEADGVISKFIDKKGEGIHHIAFEVDDLASEIDRLKKEGFTILDETPKKGADNKLICFVHPKSSNGVLIELCQSKFSKNKKPGIKPGSYVRPIIILIVIFKTILFEFDFGVYSYRGAGTKLIAGLHLLQVISLINFPVNMGVLL